MTQITNSELILNPNQTLPAGLREPGPAAARPGEPGRGGGVPGARAVHRRAGTQFNRKVLA